MNQQTSTPAVHDYCVKLRESLDHYKKQVRGPNGVADQIRMPAARLEEILAGARPTAEEHHKICRFAPRMKFYLPVLQAWEREDAQRPRPAPPMPAVAVTPTVKVVDPPFAQALVKVVRAVPDPQESPAPLTLRPRTFGGAALAEPAAPAPPPSPGSRAALVAFGGALARAAPTLAARGTRAAVAALLRAGERAGLSVEEVAAALEGEA